MNPVPKLRIIMLLISTKKSIETQLAAGTLDSYVRAEEIYNEGGHSKSYASIKLDSGLSKALSKGAQITAVSVLEKISLESPTLHMRLAQPILSSSTQPLTFKLLMSVAL